MNKKKAGLSIMSLFLVAIVFLSSLYMNVSDNFPCAGSKSKPMLVSGFSEMDMFQQQLIDGRLNHDNKTEATQIKQLVLKSLEKSARMMQYTYLIQIFLISGVLFQNGKGRIFVCFLTFSFLKVRFLYELYIRKKKDGKKWIPVCA